MNPRVYEFEDELKAINFYRTMLKKIHEVSSRYARMWYEITVQSSNLTGFHLVTIHIGITKETNEYKNNEESEIHTGRNSNL